MVKNVIVDSKHSIIRKSLDKIKTEERDMPEKLELHALENSPPIPNLHSEKHHKSKHANKKRHFARKKHMRNITHKKNSSSHGKKVYAHKDEKGHHIHKARGW